MQGPLSIFRALWQHYDDFSHDVYTPDITVGGILNFEIFKFPHQPTKQLMWTMRNVFDESDMLAKVIYPDPSNPGQQIEPHTVSYTVPDTVLILDPKEIKVGWWDEENRRWRKNDDMEIKDSFENRVIEIKVSRYSPFAILQSRVTFYPYNGWKLRMVEKPANEATGEQAEKVIILDVETRVMNIVFEIGYDYVMLIEREEPELAHLVNRKLPPGYLLHLLSKAGVHLLPVNEDGKLAGIKPKTESCEAAAIMDIICGINAFSFRSCKWNQAAPPENIVMKFRENLEYDREFFEDFEIDWTYAKWWENKVAYVKTRDSHD